MMDYYSVYILVLTFFIPGVAGDQYSLGGLVASSIISILLFVLIIIIMILGYTWSSWYPKMQRKKGKREISWDELEERDNYKRAQKASRKNPTVKYASSEVVSNARGPIIISYSNPSSMRSHQFIRPHVPMTNGTQRISDAWDKDERPKSFENKEKTMLFEEETDDVIIADVLPDDNNMYSEVRKATSAGESRSAVKGASLIIGDDSPRDSSMHNAALTDDQRDEAVTVFGRTDDERATVLY